MPALKNMDCPSAKSVARFDSYVCHFVERLFVTGWEAGLSKIKQPLSFGEAVGITRNGAKSTVIQFRHGKVQGMLCQIDIEGRGDNLIQVFIGKVYF
jgi:hypothetical protein